MMRGDHYTDFCIRFKFRPIIILISTWRIMRLTDALDYTVVKFFES